MGQASADVYINKLVVNGTENVKETDVNFPLPGDLNSGDILDTSGLDLTYNVNDSNYFVHGKVVLQPKESKTFRIRVRDIWKLDPQKVEDIKKEIEQGYDQIGKQKDQQQGELLKKHLIEKLNFVQDQGSKADSVEKRMDAYRTYSKELKRIEHSALAVDYWRSDPTDLKENKIIRFNIEVENPFDIPKSYKNKQYLPSEVKPEDLVEFEGFEVRFDQDKKISFLFREEELQPKEKRKFTIGIKDIWFVVQKDIDYLRSRSNSAYDFLKESRYAESAKTLFDHITSLLRNIDDSQAQKKDNIVEHISVFRDNQRTYENAKIDVESLEKLLSIYREDLEKSKVDNVLRKMQSLKGISNVSKAVFDKTKVSENDTWKFIFWILVFVGFLTIVSFSVWIVRSKDKAIAGDPNQTTGTAGSQQTADTSGKK